jgi:hypothetical protein
MIVLQSRSTGEAEPPAINQKSTASMSSPGGEETGEGELNYRGRQSALIEVGRVSPLTAAVCAEASGLWRLCASAWLPPLREQSTQINPLSSNTNQIPADTGQKMNPPSSQPHHNLLSLCLGKFRLSLAKFR